VYGHFGSAPFFTVVDSESGEVEVTHNTNAHHGPGGCHPMRQFGSRTIDAVVCRGMGRRAVASLREAGVQVLVMDRDAEHTVQDVVAAAREERLKPFAEQDACQGHGHGQGHGHRHGPGGCHRGAPGMGRGNRGAA
jgi:predicted Fe-Mo cluster-binding NifX family protein